MILEKDVAQNSASATHSFTSEIAAVEMANLALPYEATTVEGN